MLVFQVGFRARRVGQGVYLWLAAEVPTLALPVGIHQLPEYMGAAVLPLRQRSESLPTIEMIERHLYLTLQQRIRLLRKHQYPRNEDDVPSSLVTPSPETFHE